MRCGWCAEQHRTLDHSCPVEWCEVKKGHWCKRTVVKCANCGGPDFGQAKACPKKKAARRDAKGWRSPSPKWRQRGEAPERAGSQDSGVGEHVEDSAGDKVWDESLSGEEMEV